MIIPVKNNLKQSTNQDDSNPKLERRNLSVIVANVYISIAYLTPNFLR